MTIRELTDADIAADLAAYPPSQDQHAWPIRTSVLVTRARLAEVREGINGFLSRLASPAGQDPTDIRVFGLVEDLRLHMAYTREEMAELGPAPLHPVELARHSYRVQLAAVQAVCETTVYSVALGEGWDAGAVLEAISKAETALADPLYAWGGRPSPGNE